MILSAHATVNRLIMLSSNPTEKPNHDNANTANIASRLTVRDVGKLFNALRPAALTITAHPPSIITHVISGAVRVKRIREKAMQSISTATDVGWLNTLLTTVNCVKRLKIAELISLTSLFHSLWKILRPFYLRSKKLVMNANSNKQAH